MYEVDSGFDKKPNQATAQNQQNAKFLYNEARFKPLPEEKEKLKMPGPTNYQNDDMNNWFKRSYNMLFTE